MKKSKKSKQSKAAQMAKADSENAAPDIDGWNNFSKFTDESGKPGLTKDAQRDFASNIENLQQMMEQTRK